MRNSTRETTAAALVPLLLAAVFATTLSGSDAKVHKTLVVPIYT